MWLGQGPGEPPPRGWERPVQKALRIPDPYFADLLTSWRHGAAPVPESYLAKMRNFAEAKQRSKAGRVAGGKKGANARAKTGSTT
jgi:hypothetical protein